MPRLKKKRCCRAFDDEKIFKPAGIPRKELHIISIYLDEFEAIRLCDFEEKSQIEASEVMGVSRGTVQRLLQSGRKKIVDALLNTKAINIKNSCEDIKEKTEE
ncbi:DUF134 domain-containing protein [uncultured Ilyobacter sp.]|uniref:DUF134 domain-containing protein n=1 Tax=uncultured Ilyobacter sp. TaxID=544433 RepID=UPI0029C712F3|nr:DUF134 domain-containing protein [uncultured Ilyobacter sp.]